MSKANRRWLTALAGFFDVQAGQPDQQLIHALMVHVDVVPGSLALAQAAMESAWGTSRFSREGNNYFGQRCHRPGCGMIPEGRPAGAGFEVRRFRSAADSVASYMINLNSHPKYAAFRAYRAERRRLGLPLTGLEAAATITGYSERPQAYVEALQTIIRANRLDGPGAEPREDG